MLTFLRKVRKSLIDSSPVDKSVEVSTKSEASAKVGGSARKYIFYAIGEIALVVIGILIALQINNWNEWRKDREKEKEVLIELKENLELNVDELKSDIKRNLQRDFSCQVILNVIENNLTYHDTLNNYFGPALNYGLYVLPSKAGYESFTRIGVDIIRNQGLRKEILYLFEEDYTYLESWAKHLGDLHIETAKFRQQYLMRLNGLRWTPYDFDSLISDPKFESWVRSMMYNKRRMRRAIEENLEKTQQVLQLIKDELSE